MQPRLSFCLTEKECNPPSLKKGEGLQPLSLSLFKGRGVHPSSLNMRRSATISPYLPQMSLSLSLSPQGGEGVQPCPSPTLCHYRAYTLILQPRSNTLQQYRHKRTGRRQAGWLAGADLGGLLAGWPGRLSLFQYIVDVFCF